VDLTFYRHAADVRYAHIDQLFGAPGENTINWQLIERHWVDLMQVVLSIRAGRLSSTPLLRRLGTESRKNNIYKAFRELGRVIRTITLLRYISEPELREEITAATNKVESYNEFSAWLRFGHDTIERNDPAEQEKIIKFNTLLANCVIFHTALDMTTVLRQLAAEGLEITPAPWPRSRRTSESGSNASASTPPTGSSTRPTRSTRTSICSPRRPLRQHERRSIPGSRFRFAIREQQRPMPAGRLLLPFQSESAPLPVGLCCISRMQHSALGLSACSPNEQSSRGAAIDKRVCRAAGGRVCHRRRDTQTPALLSRPGHRPASATRRRQNALVSGVDLDQRFGALRRRIPRPGQIGQPARSPGLPGLRRLARTHPMRRCLARPGSRQVLQSTSRRFPVRRINIARWGVRPLRISRIHGRLS